MVNELTLTRYQPHGSLYIMQGDFQKHLLHGVRCFRRVERGMYHHDEQSLLLGASYCEQCGREMVGDCPIHHEPINFNEGNPVVSLQPSDIHAEIFILNRSRSSLEYLQQPMILSGLIKVKFYGHLNSFHAYAVGRMNMNEQLASVAKKHIPHYGHIQGIGVGTIFSSTRELCASGVHRMEGKVCSDLDVKQRLALPNLISPSPLTASVSGVQGNMKQGILACINAW